MRHENWPEILADEIKAARERPFSWGVHDCCAFSAGVVAAMTGRNFMQAFSAYETQEQAAALLDQHDGVRGIATACLGQPIPPLCAQRGDVVVVDSKDGEALGICDGVCVVVAAPRGLTWLKLTDAMAAWRVG